MILPPHDPVTGEVKQGNYGDIRVPADFAWDSTPTPVGFTRKTDACIDRRHLFDAIKVEKEMNAEGAEEDDDNPGVHQRLVLTCVRCGIIEAFTGTVSKAESFQIQPTPIRSGPLRAQQIHENVYDLSTWAVFQDQQIGPGNILREERQVGIIRWARGARLRRYFIGRLDAWEQTRSSVEGDTPEDALRKLTKAFRYDNPYQ